MQPKTVTALLDSGASSTIIHCSKMGTIPKQTTKRTTWTTAKSSFETVSKCPVALWFLELNNQQVVNHHVHITDRKLTAYNMIIGRDLLSALGMSLDYAKKLVAWDDASCPMKTEDQLHEIFISEVGTSIGASTSHVKHILDANYKKADLVQVSQKNKELSK